MKTPEEEARYNAALERMSEAARHYMATHPFAEPMFRFGAFEQEMAEQAGRRGQKPAVIATLRSVIDRIAVNADGVALLRAMDAAAAGEGGASYLMAKALIEAAIEARIERGQGEMPAGDWRCSCGAMCDGFTAVDGAVGKPEPGSFMVCAYCARINRVADGGDRFREASQKELHALPTSMRKQLFAARSACEAMAKRRSSS